jgi:hypothetical protein
MIIYFFSLIKIEDRSKSKEIKLNNNKDNYIY